MLDGRRIKSLSLSVLSCSSRTFWPDSVRGPAPTSTPPSSSSSQSSQCYLNKKSDTNHTGENLSDPNCSIWIESVWSVTLVMASNTAAMVEAEVNLEYSQSAAAPFNLPRGREMTYDGNHCSHQSRHCHQHSHTHRHLSCVYGAPDLLWHSERKDVKPKVKVAEESQLPKISNQLLQIRSELLSCQPMWPKRLQWMTSVLIIMGSPVSPVSIHRSSPRLLAPALQDMILHGDLTNTKPKPYKAVIL